MAITAAQIESNGWVLRLTVTGAAGSWASYTLDPDGAPRVRLAHGHPGYVRSAGQAVPGVLARMTVATRALRKPATLTSNPGTPDWPVLDEIDLAGGQVQVRLALSEWVHASDTGLTLSVSAGWRTGEAAASGIAVINNSANPAPVPIMRWVVAPFETMTGPFRLSMIVASLHPQGFDPVAAVKFTVTDGSAVRTVWATAQATDNSMGDKLRCYTVIVDPAGLNPGLLRCDAEVYPWLGAMRSTDPAGTRSMAGLASVGLQTAAETPLVLGHDPAGTRYNNAYVCLDPVNGTTTPAVAMVGATLAAARSVAATARPRDVSTALRAIYDSNRSLAAANGGTASARALDGGVVVLAAGLNLVGATGAGLSTTTAELPVTLMGDPANADPRANCRLQANGFNLRLTRLRLRDLTLECGTSNWGSIIKIYWIDNVEIRGIAGQEASTAGALGGGYVAGQWNICATRSKVWRTGFQLTGYSGKVGLARAVEHARTLSAITAVGCRFIPESEDNSVSGEIKAYGGNPESGDTGGCRDVVLAWCKAYGLKGSLWTPTAYDAGGGFQALTHQLVIGTIAERIGSSASNFIGYGENNTGNLRMANIIYEYNSFVGERFNAFYNEPRVVTLADTTSIYNEAFNIRMANNFFDRNGSKQDDFNDPETSALRGAGVPGYRPQLVQCWGPHHGVAYEANFDAVRQGTPGIAEHEFSGLRSVGSGDRVQPLFTDDRSLISPGPNANTGNGNYLPTAASPLLGRVLRGNGDVDSLGNARRVNGASGAIEFPLAGTTLLAPAASRSLQMAAVAGVGIGLGLIAASAVHGQAAGPTGIGWATAIAAQGSLQALGSGAAAVSVAGSDTLVPDSALLRLLPAPALLLPDGALAMLHTLAVRADPRTLLVK